MTVVESPMKDFLNHICVNCTEKSTCPKREKEMLTCADILAARSLSFISNFLAGFTQYCGENYR